ncbi:progestin and adipoQ receptor family member 4-like [Ptychodera flava]|uniref:progestin and adipoQ receptor family member 4-like n=1 Tax=Ptychodera flava TaxID=63121 RepID=UPI00396A995C
MSTSVRLVDFACMPDHLRFNRFVLTGYRPLMSVVGCLYSLFYFHNESINVYSHLLPLLYILLMMPVHLPWQTISGSVTWLSILHSASVVVVLSGSVAYHLCMNHCRGRTVYKKLLRIDVCGIWTVNTFGCLANVSATFGDRSIGGWLVPAGLYVLFSIVSLRMVLSSRTQLDRAIAFLVPSLARYIAIYLRATGYLGGSPTALQYIICTEVLSLIGATINVCRIPERWSPGLFDYVFNSHQIFHFLSLIGLFTLHTGALDDMRWLDQRLK